MITKTTKINAQITITASYDDSIEITVHDKISSTNFLKMFMTREQWINATMNRLAHTEVDRAALNDVWNVGKKMEMDQITFEIPKHGDVKTACRIATEICPEGWRPELTFNSQNSFYIEDGKYFARTTIRRWV